MLSVYCLAPSLGCSLRGQGLPHPRLRKWHRPPTNHSDETPGRPKGKAVKQRAPEPPAFTHLSLARASMNIWCIFKGNTAIKWRELLVVGGPSPWPVSFITFFGKLLFSGPLVIDGLFCENRGIQNLSHQPSERA